MHHVNGADDCYGTLIKDVTPTQPRVQIYDNGRSKSSFCRSKIIIISTSLLKKKKTNRQQIEMETQTLSY